MKTKKYFIATLCFIAIILFGGMVYALNTADTGFRINSGGVATTIDLTSTCGDCKKVTRTAAGDIFVPTKSCAEWNAFKANTTGITLADCAAAPIPCPGTPTVTDIDGNVYNTVQIGTQCWMKENLKVTRQPTGTPVTRYCYPDGAGGDYCNTEGGFYKWDVLMNGSMAESAQGICAPGWHIPSNAEWLTLGTYLWDGTGACGGDIYEFYDCSGAGTKLKSVAAGGTNESGFGALLGGVWDVFEYHGRGSYGYYATSSRIVIFGDNAIYKEFFPGSQYLSQNANGFRWYSVRCVKD